MRDLRAAGAKDAEFLFRLAKTLNGVQRARNEIGLHGLADLEAAAKAEPKLLDVHDAEVHDLLEYWLGEEQDPTSFARRLVVARGFEAWKPRLVEALAATTGEGSEAKPDVAKRANAFAILVDGGEKRPVADRIAFLDEMLAAFVEGSVPALSHAHARALFAGPMDATEFTRLRAQLESEVDRAQNGQGPFGASTDAKANLTALVDDLLSAQPDLATSAK